ncbi:MAG TPA: hypothetical protein RMH80_31595 [Polyangiaceae bacterium LLY-WYZ-15_(1-7)]|nr:hypothetical protein [Polyangiaceae bacterium LLY-WYZ-15_(1-7)]
MDRFLHALQGGQLPAGIRSVLDLRFGEEMVAGLIDAGLLTRGARATRYPCPRGGSSCPREVVENPGDDAFPFVAIPPGAEVCCPSVRLTAEELVTWQTSRRALVTKLSELYAVRGPANLRDEVFPCAHRLGRAAWRGLDREVLLCTDLNGAAPLAFLLARQASQQPTLVLAHARTRYTPPDVDTHFAAGPVSVVFLEDELRLDGDRLVRAQPMGVAEPVATYRTAAYCLLVDAEGARRIDEATYRNLVADAEDHDLFLDLLSTVAAGRYRACRRDDGGFHEDSLTHQQAWAYAELMERRQPLRAGSSRCSTATAAPTSRSRPPAACST